MGFLSSCWVRWFCEQVERGVALGWDAGLESGDYWEGSCRQNFHLANFSWLV